MRSLVVVLAWALISIGTTVGAEEGSTDKVWVRLKDGSQLVGRVVSENETQIELRTEAGVSVRIPRATIEWMGASPGERKVSDPNETRLFFAPTGRPLRKGDGYFSDHQLIFPGVSYGLTDNVTVMGGFSTIPGLGFDEQLFYVAPKIGTRVSDSFAVSAGYLFARAGEDGFEEGVGLGFAVATVGGNDRSLTTGFGLAHSDGGDATPIVMAGAQARLSKRLFFVTENWFILHDDFDLSYQPFSVGLRFCSDRLSVDFGAILIKELIDEGFPLPWISFSYHFGPSTKPRASATAR